MCAIDTPMVTMGPQIQGISMVKYNYLPFLDVDDYVWVDCTPQTTQAIDEGSGSKNDCGQLQNTGQITEEKCNDKRACLCENSGIGKAGGEYNGEYNWIKSR